MFKKTVCRLLKISRRTGISECETHITCELILAGDSRLLSKNENQLIFQDDKCMFSSHLSDAIGETEKRTMTLKEPLHSNHITVC